MVYFLACFCSFLTIPAYAYVDPATTAMLTQVVAGIFISLGVFFSVFRRRIILFFKKLSVKRTQRKIEKQARASSKKENE